MRDSESDDELLRAVARAPDATPPTERDARIGTTIREKYTLERVLGEGGMAIVYEGVHRNAKRFAIKVLKEKFSNSDVRARFVREGYVANSVRHPGAVAILDDDVAEDGAPFLVMELLDGEPLDRLAAKGPLPLRAALVITARMLDVLAAAHEKGIIHRDVKPQNVFVTRMGEVKLLDFGIARMHSPSSSEITTATGAMLGTPAFMAPEQALGHTKAIDARSDVWSVGATLFTLLTGRFVHEGESSQAAGVPSEVARILERALAFDQADRWPDAASMRDALLVAHRDQFRTEPSAAEIVTLFCATLPPTTPTPARRTATARRVLVGTFVVVAASVGAFWVSQNRAKPEKSVASTPMVVACETAPTPTAPSSPPTTAVVVPSTIASEKPAAVPPRLARPRNCNPPYTVDDSGKRIPKPECL